MSEAQVYQSPTSDMMDTIGTEKAKFFSPSQRLGRVRYFFYSNLYTLVGYLIIALLAFIGFSIHEALGTALVVLSSLALIAITYTLLIRRLHDLGKSGWLSLLMLVPIVNFGMAIYIMFGAGTESGNQYGAKTEPNTALTWIGALSIPVILAIGFSVLMSTAMPAYQDYTERAQEAATEQESYEYAE